MSDYFLGEIRIFPYAVTPKYWLPCAGQQLPINQYQALFSLLGITYGGNGTSNFNLPDLRGRAPVCIGQGNASLPAFTLGQKGGEETHALALGEIPQHYHTVGANASVAASNNTNVPTSATVLGQSGAFGTSTFAVNIYNSTLTSAATVASAMIANAGSGAGHENRQPYLPMNVCIAAVGIYPSRP